MTRTGPDAEKGGRGATGPAAAEPHYMVLARKYRPQTFKDLIGQDAMVRTLRNAFATGRIAQAYMLTGVRGVGKTTTARILARALNYELPGVAEGPTIDMDGLGVHCQQIIDSRHPDVIEMDAASNTGIDNVREIIESARYHPVAARIKVYIIDEVHMLSKGAFNALLKTLEEPPAHVKFIFATTEIRKVPVTVLSRCQRFDLRRVEVPVLAAHFRRIAEVEGIDIDEEALLMIARAAEGSVRDGLSILDQAFAIASGRVAAGDIRARLGLADRGRIFDLIEAVLGGDARSAVERFGALYRDGADPLQLVGDLAEVVHVVTRIRVAGAAAATDTLSGEERDRSTALAGRLTVGLLSRAWQMLLKGLDEAARAPDTAAAAEMLLIRMAHMASLPSPEDIVRRIGEGRDGAGGGVQPGERPGSAGRAEEPRRPLNRAPEPARGASGPVRRAGVPAEDGVVLQSFADLVAFVGEKRDALLRIELEERVRLVRFEPPRIELNLVEGADPALAADLADKLRKWTGERWMVALSREPGERPLGEVRREQEAAEIEAVRQHPAMKAALEQFPDLEITHVRPLSPDAASEDEDSAAG
ncbi:MAG: DNA polymerase III subunit gamma/tau [Hyphomicrobiaceae bacterium]